METETKVNFVWIVLAVILAGISMPIWAVTLLPIGLVLMAILVIAGIAGIGLK